MTGAASTSIQISYSTEDGGIATEEIVGFGESELLSDLEDAEEYPLSQPTVPSPTEFLKNTSKLIKRSIEYELKMVTFIRDNNFDGVRNINVEEDVPPRSHLTVSHQASSLHKAQTHVREFASDKSEKNDDIPTISRVATGTCSNPLVTGGDRQEATIESCLRESIEVCLGNSGVFEQNAEDIVDHHHHRQGQQITTEKKESVESSPISEILSMENHNFTTTYDGPPILSPNYEVEDHTESIAGTDERPPALTKEPEGIKEIRRGRGRPPGLKNKRSFKHHRHVITDRDHRGDKANGKLPAKGYKKDAPALHRTHNPVVIPHSSAEIQERVKNRQRKTTQSYGMTVICQETSSEGASVDKAINKTKPRARKVSSESSNSETKPRKIKSQSQNGLFIVEKILKKGIINGRPYFYVKWLNYPSSKNTWEPEENFSLDLIAAYEKKVAETGQLVKVIDDVDVNQSPPEFRSVMRNVSSKSRSKVKCPGCMSYPHTFTDNRNGRNGFDEHLTYHKILESFILDDEWCALVEFAEKHSLELIPLTVINDRLKGEIQLH